MSVWFYDPIEAQRQFIRTLENEAVMHQRGVDYYAETDPATADKFRALVKSYTERAADARERLLALEAKNA